MESRLLNHGKGGSRAYYGYGATLPTYHGDDTPDPNMGGYQRLRYALEEIRQGLHGMVQPAFVIINFGMNDHKRVWKSGVSTGQSSPADFRLHLKLLVDLVRTNGAIPILVTPHDFHQGTPDDLDSYYSAYSPELFNNVEDHYSALGRFHLFLAEMRAVAAGFVIEDWAPVDLVDVNQASSHYDANEFTVTGGVHLDKLGHDIYARVIGDYLSARYGDGSPAPPPTPPPTNCPPPAQPPPPPITGNFVLTRSGCWTAGENWNQAQPPGETNLVFIRSDLTADITWDVGTIRRFYLGDNASTYPPGTGTLNILSGGALVTSLDAPEVGRRNTPGAVGRLNLHGGVLQLGTTGNHVLRVGMDSPGTPVTGTVTITGGDFRGRLVIGSSGVVGATPDLLRIMGDAATIGSDAAGTGLEVCESGTVEFVFNATGISGMAYPVGAGVFHPGARMVVDGAEYEGPATAFELLRCASFSGMPQIILQNLPPGTDHEWSPITGVFRVLVQEAAAPGLECGFHDGLLALSWPEAFLGWHLQSNSVSLLDPSQWGDIAESDAATRWIITPEFGLSNVFYRLRKP